MDKWGCPGLVCGSFTPRRQLIYNEHGQNEDRPGKTVKAARPIPHRKVPEVIPATTPPMFRRVDWMVFYHHPVCVAGLLDAVADLGLEDSGELAVGSLYAGIPHPPGYPV